MKWMKKVMVTMLALCMAVSFAGCKSNNEPANQGSTNQDTTTNDNETSDQNQASDKVVEIEFFQQKVEAVDTYNALIKKFEEENSNIKVIQNNVPDAGSVLMARVASDDTPDVFSDYPNTAEFKIRAEEGFMYDFTGQAFLNNVKEGIVESVEINEGNYTLPISVNTIGVYYNTRIFKELGLEPPKEYTEFELLLETLKNNGYTPLALADKESWTVGITLNQMSGCEFDNAEAFYASLENGTGDAAESPDLRRMAERLVALRDYSTEDALAVGYGDAINLFANEETVMLIQGIWAMPSIQKANPDVEFSMFPVPASNTENQKVIYGIDAAVSMSADTEHPEEALKFIEFLAQPENAQIFTNMDKSPSTIIGVETSVKEFKMLTDLLDVGKSFQWHHFKWKAGMEGQFNDTAQELIVTKDIDAYLKQMNAIFAQ